MNDEYMMRLKKKDVRRKRHNEKKELHREIDEELGRLHSVGGVESHDIKHKS